MTQEERSELKKLVAAMAGIYGRYLEENSLELYLDLLNNLDYKKTQKFIYKYLLNTNRQEMPTPALIRDTVEYELLCEQYQKK
jgi:hypothetical protein